MLWASSCATDILPASLPVRSQGTSGLNFASLQARLFSVHRITGLILVTRMLPNTLGCSNFPFVSCERKTRGTSQGSVKYTGDPFWQRPVIDLVEMIPLTVGSTCSAVSNRSSLISRVPVAVPLWNITTTEVMQIKSQSQ